MIYYAPLFLIILSSTLYHFTQKATPTDVHPLLALVITYGVAALVCLAMLPLFPIKTSLSESLRKVNWASFVLALAITGIEVGFLLAYRAGWKISMAALITNTSVALLLIPVGVLGYAEKLSINQAAGIVLCIAGLILINLK